MTTEKLRTRHPGPWGTLDQFTGKPRYVAGSGWQHPTTGYCSWKSVWVNGRKPGGKGHLEWTISGSRNLEALRDRLGHLVTHRGRPEDVPEPGIAWVPVQMTGNQMRIYENARRGLMDVLRADTGTWNATRIESVWTQIGVLRSICAMSPGAFMSNKVPEWAQNSFSLTGQGAKQKWVRENLIRNLEPDDRLVVFSEWTRATSETVALLEKSGLDVAHFHGGLSEGKRQKVREAWAAGDLQAIVCSPAGYNSINLQEGVPEGAWVYTVMLDCSQWYKMAQRMGRTVRTGLKGKPVIVMLYAQNSIEVEWAAHGGGDIVPDFERLIGETSASEMYPADTKQEIMELLGKAR